MCMASAKTGDEPLSARRRRAQGAVDRMLGVVPWYNGLPDAEREEIRGRLRMVTLRTGEYLFRAGAPTARPCRWRGSAREAGSAKPP